MAHLVDVEKLGTFLDSLPHVDPTLEDATTRWLRLAYWDLTQARGAMVRCRTILGSRTTNGRITVAVVDEAVQHLTDVLR